MGASVTFRKRDLATALSVARDTGMVVAGTEIDRNGTIRLLYETTNKPKQKKPIYTDNLKELVNAETKKRTS